MIFNLTLLCKQHFEWDRSEQEVDRSQLKLIIEQWISDIRLFVREIRYSQNITYNLCNIFMIINNNNNRGNNNNIDIKKHTDRA